MVLRTLGRLILIPIAFVLSALAATAILMTLGLEKITHAMQGTGPGIETLEAYTNLLFQGWDLLAGVSIVPALAVIIAGEVARIRSWIYYMLGGGAALASMPLLAHLVRTGAGVTTTPPETLWHVLATAGFAGGLVYWLIAGRRA